MLRAGVVEHFGRCAARMRALLGVMDVLAADGEARNGAHTGCTSAEMLHDAGAVLTIVGHSERREAHRETDEEVKAKAQAALTSGLKVILCVGESLQDREAGRALEIVSAQLAASLPHGGIGAAGLSVAYEPIWAIGTGKIPSMQDIG